MTSTLTPMSDALSKQQKNRKKSDVLVERDVRTITPSRVHTPSVMPPSAISCVKTQSNSIASTPLVKLEDLESSKFTRTLSLDLKGAISMKERINKKLMNKARNSIEMTAKNPTNDRVDFLELIEKHYKNPGEGVSKIRYTPAEFEMVITEATDVFCNEKALIDVDPPCVVVGDLHGQFNDLVNMFILVGRPPETVYVFTGDYVDRGMMSIECIMLLFAYKIAYPENIFLLRGNHEIARVNMKYGFYDECVANIPKQGEEIWAEFQRCFNNLPIAALVGTKILCMHGGLSPSLVSLNDLREHPKPIRNPYRGIVNDMLWADPDLAVFEWKTSNRGSGFTFGQNVIDEVCDRLEIELIIRAHQMCFDGYWAISGRKLITIFSAPVYCNLYKNAGCVLKVDKKLCVQLVIFVPESPKVEKNIADMNRVWDMSFDNIEN